MTYGDPKDMSEQERTEGHAGMKKVMDPHVRALTEASGGVSDHRRLVSMIYLVLRDHVTCGCMADLMGLWRTMKPVKDAFKYMNCDKANTEFFVSRVVDVQHQASVCDWVVAVLHSHQSNTISFPALLNLIPVDDKTETLYTNGWLACYAQYIAAELEADGR